MKKLTTPINRNSRPVRGIVQIRSFTKTVLNHSESVRQGVPVINIVNIFLVIAFLFTLGIRFYFSDKASIAGINLGQYESEIIAYEKQNEFLTNRYLTLTSLSMVKPLALENGYVEANVEYYTSPELAVR